MNGSATLRVNLRQPIRVMILYDHGARHEAGPVLFFDDLYGYDASSRRCWSCLQC